MGESKLSQVYFREGNRIDMDLHFGCGLFVFDKAGKQAEGIEAILDLFKQLNADPSDPNWKEVETFFISMTAQLDLDFSDDAKKMKSLDPP